jgi:lipoprotein-releasing system ATP-binding protein
MNKLIEVSGLHKSYLSGGRRIEVLKGVDFSFGKGESFAVVGASGVGKSTLLNLIGALDRPDSGSIRFNGKELDMFLPEDLAHFRNFKIGFIFQFFHLLPEFSALENVIMPYLIRGMEEERAKKRAEMLVSEVGLLERATHHPSELSGGEQQRVAIARAIMGEPEVILADEPTGNLDEETGERVFSLLFSLKERHGLSLILATHNLKLAERCDRVMRLENGRLNPLFP